MVACSTGGLGLGFSGGGVTVTGGSTVPCPCPCPGCGGCDEAGGGSTGFVPSGGVTGGVVVVSGCTVPGGLVVSVGPCDAASPAKHNSIIAELFRSSRRFLRMDIATPVTAMLDRSTLRASLQACPAQAGAAECNVRREGVRAPGRERLCFGKYRRRAQAPGALLRNAQAAATSQAPAGSGNSRAR